MAVSHWALVMVVVVVVVMLAGWIVSGGGLLVSLRCGVFKFFFSSLDQF